MKIQPLVTIHNADATRIWVVETSNSGAFDHVVLCDTAMLATTRTLCMRGAIATPPGTTGPGQ